MAVILQTSGVGGPAYPFYTGESSDVKPQPTGADATFFELDTRRTYVWRGGQWFLYAEPAQVSGWPQLIQAIGNLQTELHKLRLGMIAAKTCKDIS